MAQLTKTCPKNNNKGNLAKSEITDFGCSVCVMFTNPIQTRLVDGLKASILSLDMSFNPVNQTRIAFQHNLYKE